MTDTATVPVNADAAADLVAELGKSRRDRIRLLLDLAFAVALFVATLVGVLVLGALIWSILSSGWGRFIADPWGFLNNYSSRRASRAGVRAGLVGSALLGLMVGVIAFPIGVGAAVYLEEFARPGRLRSFVDANIANLAGVPSVVYGLLGLTLFVRFFGMGPSLLAGALTLSMMSLPIIVVTTRESLKTVPPSIREASWALGATTWQTVRRQVLPAALPGTLTGTILALSRAIGETAPLIVIGAAVAIFSTPHSLSDPFSALPLMTYTWVKRPQADFKELAAAASLVLLGLLLALNAVAIFLRNRFTVKWQ